MLTVFYSSPDKLVFLFNFQALSTPVLRMRGFLITPNDIVVSAYFVRTLSIMPDKFPNAPRFLCFYCPSLPGHPFLELLVPNIVACAPSSSRCCFTHRFCTIFIKSSSVRRAIRTYLMNGDLFISAVQVVTFRVVMNA